MMTTRVFRTKTNGAHVGNGVPGSSKTMTGIPSHLGYMAGKPAAASTPPRGVLLPRIPPSSRANMGRLANGGTHATYRYEHPEGSSDELQHICMQGKGNDEGEARATTSGTRKRGAHNKVSTCFSRAFGLRVLYLSCVDACVSRCCALMHAAIAVHLYSRSRFTLSLGWGGRRSRLQASSGCFRSTSLAASHPPGIRLRLRGSNSDFAAFPTPIMAVELCNGRRGWLNVRHFFRCLCCCSMRVRVPRVDYE